MWGPTHVAKQTKGISPFCLSYKGNAQCAYVMYVRQKKNKKKERVWRHRKGEREKEKEKEKGFA